MNFKGIFEENKSTIIVLNIKVKATAIVEIDWRFYVSLKEESSFEWTINAVNFGVF